MVFTLALPDEYPWVLTVAAVSQLINVAHAVNTSSQRKASGITYPTTYASEEKANADPKAYAFNCAQRSHANFTEGYTSFLTSLLITGLKYPVLATTLGTGFILGRVLYMRGYTKTEVGGNGKGRLVGAMVAGPSHYVLILASIFTGVSLALKW